MGFAALHMNERFRPWYEAGLRFLYREGTTPEEDCEQNTVRREIPWDRVWEKYRPKLARRGKTMWTYWDLGYDLGGRPDPGRRKLLKALMDALGWPKGSIAFWPVAYLEDEDLFPNPDLFWRGVREARSRVVICLGKRAFRTLFPQKNLPRQNFVYNNFRVLPLPGPAEIASGGEGLKKKVLTALQGLKVV